MVLVAMLHGKQLVEKENSNVKLLQSYELNNGYNDQLMKSKTPSILPTRP